MKTPALLDVDPRDDAAIAKLNAERSPQFVTVRDDVDLAVIPAFRLLAARLHARHPILLKDVFDCRASVSDASEMAAFHRNALQTCLRRFCIASTNIGSLLCDGIGDAILVQGEEAPGQALRLSYNILQAAGSRIFKTDYVARPSCGRTLFNLQTTTAKIKEATLHLKGVKIAIMGCIVNGPGEMADADFGYVGGAPGKVNLYVGKTAVKFNIPEAEAVDRLKDLIREHGKWVEPASRSSRARTRFIAQRDYSIPKAFGIRIGNAQEPWLWIGLHQALSALQKYKVKWLDLCSRDVSKLVPRERVGKTKLQLQLQLKTMKTLRRISKNRAFTHIRILAAVPLCRGRGSISVPDGIAASCCSGMLARSP